MKITPREKRRHAAGWGDFHARSRFARSTIPEKKWGTTVSLVFLRIISYCCGNHYWFAFVLWCGYRSLSFQSFVLRHILITNYKKLPFFLRATRECAVTRLHHGKNMVKKRSETGNKKKQKKIGERREPSCRLRRTTARLAPLADFFRLFLQLRKLVPG